MENRWAGITRPYSPEDVERLRGSLPVQHTLAENGARRLWHLLHSEPWVPLWRLASGSQAVSMVRAGARAILVSSGAAGDAAGGVPDLVRRVSRALQRADEADHAEGRPGRDWLVPLVADAGAGSTDPLQAFELTRAMIEAGAAAVCFDDGLASARTGGDAESKTMVSTGALVRTLVAARLAADVMGVPTLLLARTHALGATLLSSDADPRDREFVLAGERTAEGGFRLRGGVECAAARAGAWAPYADVLWLEAARPDPAEARSFAAGLHQRHPGKRLACEASAWLEPQERPDERARARIERDLCSAGYQLQLVAPLGPHSVSDAATSATAESGSSYSDRILQVVSGSTGSTPAPREPKAAEPS